MLRGEKMEEIEEKMGRRWGERRREDEDDGGQGRVYIPNQVQLRSGGQPSHSCPPRSTSATAGPGELLLVSFATSLQRREPGDHILYVVQVDVKRPPSTADILVAVECHWVAHW